MDHPWVQTAGGNAETGWSKMALCLGQTVRWASLSTWFLGIPRDWTRNLHYLLRPSLRGCKASLLLGSIGSSKPRVKGWRNRCHLGLGRSTKSHRKGWGHRDTMLWGPMTVTVLLVMKFNAYVNINYISSWLWNCNQKEIRLKIYFGSGARIHSSFDVMHPCFKTIRNHLQMSQRNRTLWFLWGL